MRNLLRTVLVLAASGVSSLLIGCSGGSAKYDVLITPDAALKGEATPPSIAVDVVAVPAAEVAAWRSVPMSAYWAPDSPLRNSKQAAIKQFIFGPGHMAEQKLAHDDPIWASWKGADTLFVLARLPGGGGSAGDGDPRRVAYPLDRSRWDQDVLRVGLSRSALRAESTPKPEKK